MERCVPKKVVPKKVKPGVEKWPRLTIAVDPEHPLIQLEQSLDWEEVLDFVEDLRRERVKSPAGRRPHLRALTGAVLMGSVMKHTYRFEADLIRHFGPARYLCGLTETDWSPAKSTLWDFMKLLGEDGLRELNEFVVKMAIEKGFTKKDLLAADTTAQEAAIPHPNEMGLMASFLKGAQQASEKLGGTFRTFLSATRADFQKAKVKLREYRLFAKTKASKDRLMKQTVSLVRRVQKRLEASIESARLRQQPLVKYQKVAFRKAQQLGATVKLLLPQILSWLRTGFVAANKIINLHIPELYSVVRGKVGKAVEFGLNWGIARLRGGYLLARRSAHKKELLDTRWAIRAVDDHIGLFGKAPREFAYDRAADAKEVFATLKERGVKRLGIARKGKAPWLVAGTVRKRLISERAQVEAGIGTIKSHRYGFNKPQARTLKMMGVRGQAAVLGLNLHLLMRDLNRKRLEDSGAA